MYSSSTFCFKAKKGRKAILQEMETVLHKKWNVTQLFWEESKKLQKYPAMVACYSSLSAKKGEHTSEKHSTKKWKNPKQTIPIICVQKQI